jgi:CheY-like chemotaxis protein/DNA-directed RNA polymerase specialized sigma24 family protein
MNRSEVIAPHLPFLRRYARALTGNQNSGDSYVRACLEAVLASPEILPETIQPRVALYQVFHTIWSSVAEHGNLATPESDEARTANARMARLVPEQRQALLLSTLEGFSVEEVATILHRSPDQIRLHVRSALDDIARDIATDVLIIEDEPVIALDLSNIVEELGHRVTHVAATRSDAVKAARKHRPGLVLADIQLADNSSGIDAVKDILGDGRVPVIFITAYPERLLTGERPEPTFLITKPFMPEAIKAAVSQALFLYSPVGAERD